MNDAKSKSLAQCGFRHYAPIRNLIDDIVRAENSEFTLVMRQLVNTALQEKYGARIVGNEIVDRGRIPSLTKVSQAS
ncbi:MULTISPECIES: hypothetical protein [unclassified Methylophaga]|jgi:hypothetical protein|uniref:hypothetical protein n=1 Tax=unclassified Methylophaga TaxID=2629249 RepID=UPI00259CFAFA|nr:MULTISPECIES: hypothetical protein [unclassified Methylophaga]|tara:strand:+ start:2506 stop:2736 length:231 start_codon:yes stop_codon:yes gene_type:complete